jgi:hypothetical protein
LFQPFQVFRRDEAAAVLAAGTLAAQVPPLRLLTYGGVLTAITALIFVSAYIAWQERVSELRDTLHPIPEDGRVTHDWLQARDDLDTLLAARSSAGRVFAAAFAARRRSPGHGIQLAVPGRRRVDDRHPRVLRVPDPPG